MASHIESPTVLLATVPCAQGLSDKQLLSRIVLVLCSIVSSQCGANALLADTQGWQNASESQMLQGVFALLHNHAVLEGYIQEGCELVGVSCVECLSEHQIKAIILSLIGVGIDTGAILPSTPI